MHPRTAAFQLWQSLLSPQKTDVWTHYICRQRSFQLKGSRRLWSVRMVPPLNSWNFYVLPHLNNYRFVVFYAAFVCLSTYFLNRALLWKSDLACSLQLQPWTLTLLDETFSLTICVKSPMLMLSFLTPIITCFWCASVRSEMLIFSPKSVYSISDATLDRSSFRASKYSITVSLDLGYSSSSFSISATEF